MKQKFIELINKRSFLNKVRDDSNLPEESKTQIFTILGHKYTLADKHNTDINSSKYISMTLNVHGFSLASFYSELKNEFDVRISDKSNSWFELHVDDLDRFIEKYENFASIKAYTLPRIGWSKEIKWSNDTIQKYSRFISWHELHRNPTFKLNFELIEAHKDKINWSYVSSSSDLNWTLESLLKFKEYLIFSVEKIGWEKKGKNKLGNVYTVVHPGDDWRMKERLNHLNGSISLSSSIPWNKETLAALMDYWDWDELSINNHIPWDDHLISTFETKINFKLLSQNTSVSWNEDLIKKYSNKWDWRLLSNNPGLPWSKELIINYQGKWIWNTDFGWYTDNDIYNWPCLSKNAAIPWDNELITKFADKIDLWLISRFGRLTNEVIIKNSTRMAEQKLVGWKHHRYSDWRATENLYRTCWENLALNKNFKLSNDIIPFLYNEQIELTKGDDDLQFARDENYETAWYRILFLLRDVELIDVTIVDILNNLETWSQVLVNSEFINDYLYQEILLPEVLTIVTSSSQ